MNSLQENNALKSVPAYVINICALIAATLLVCLSQPSDKNAFKYHFEEGKIWTYKTLVADFDFPIYKPESEYIAAQEEVLRQYSPCFQYVGLRSDLKILSALDMQHVIDGNFDCITVINRKHIAQKVSLSELYTPKTAYEKTGREMVPNLTYDSLTSARTREELLAQVSPTEGAVLKGETVIEKGALISHENYQILLSMEKTYAEKGLSARSEMLTNMSRGLLICLLVFAFAAYLFVFRKPLWEQPRDVLFFCLIMCVMACGSVLLLQHASSGFIYLIPFAWIPILVRVFYDSRTAFLLHLVTVLIVSLMVSEPFLFLFLQIPAGMIVITALKDLTRRSQLANTSAYVLLIYSAVYTLFHVMFTGNITHLAWQPYVFFLINSVLIIAVYSIIYLLERLFRLTSSITLVELSNLNSDLMHEFADKAPGTFQHSLQVSSLASEAAKSIGAKALLVRTGALYHDIGKMQNPQWYVENQSEENNPLLEMTNLNAAQAVISHVIEGEKIARKHNLPELIIRFIQSHHGTSLVRYFYNSEVNRLHKEGQDEAAVLDPDTFRYPGPRPKTKEEAILMMADAVEARARSLTAYTEQTITDMVEQMINAQIQDGQLAETPLSFYDLERIKHSFRDRLLSIHHHRIQYPTIEQK
jgi:putative nucleotidyltransferase with HDIG domain